MILSNFPAAKLIALTMRQLSKYLANFMKKRAKQSEFFCNYICMPPAQIHHYVEVKTKMWAMNLGRPVEVKRLNKVEAIELGASLLGEFVLFCVAALGLILEIVRQTTNERKKRNKAIAERLAIKQGFINLSYEMDVQDAQILELRRALSKLGAYMREKPYERPKIHKKNQHAQTSTKMVTKQTQTIKIK